MKQILSVARRELRAYFVSPVALIFLATFLFVVLFSFFFADPTFFRRNIADVRPLFHWLPVLLIFLVAALTMRLWSEEQRSGTLEILLTLPVKTHRLVLGKFLAGIALVAIALVLTLGLPITVSFMGDLDWGPVIGGYLGALLLAAAYLSVGLCVSASTSNPIVALLLTFASCGALYLVGAGFIAGVGGNRVSELLALLGTGSRFESIRRGVLDLRDLLYYVSLTVGFLFLNTVLLEAKRWSAGASTRPRRSALKMSVALIVANLLVLNVALASVRWARLDLTERKEYSISDATKKVLHSLDAPLLIRGYFSAKTHPLLAPLVPRIRDRIEEYGVVGGDNVVVEFIDPQQNPAAEKEANEDYGIKSVPFQFASRHEQGVVNSYFTVLVKYGDKYETLGFQDLIEVKVSSMTDIEVRLRNLEYDLTRAIKKVVYGFEPLETLFARATDKIKLTAYITKDSLPENLRKVPERVRKVAKELQERSGGKFTYSEVDPSGPQGAPIRQELMKKYGLKPFVASLFGGDYFYLHLLIESGDQHERVFPTPEMSEADVRTALTAALKRMIPGFLKTVGLVLPEAPPQPRQNPMMMGRRPPPPQAPGYRMLRRKLAENYTVKTANLKDGKVAGDIDVLAVLRPENLDDKQRFAIDQFLMRGGAVVIATGAYSLNPSPMGGLAVKKVDSKLSSLLATWGIDVSSKLVLDPQNEAFPVPVKRNVMGMNVREIRLIKYPFWVDVRSSGMAEDSPIPGGLPSVTMQWASPLEVSKKEGVKTTVLLRSSEGTWLQDDANVQPDFAKYPNEGFGHDDKTQTKAQVLAVSAVGSFTSGFKGQTNPLFAAADDKKDNKDDNRNSGVAPKAGTDKSGGVSGSEVIEKSPDSARLVVIGSGDFVRDEVLGISRQTGSDRFTNNLEFFQNVVDWAVEDVDLLSIRSRGTYARTLKPMEDSEKSTWELINYGMVVIALVALIGLVFIRRRSLQPMALVNGSKSSKGGAGRPGGDSDHGAQDAAHKNNTEA